MVKKELDYYLDKINEENAKQFIKINEKYYNKITKSKNIKSPEKYFSLTDYNNKKSALVIMFKNEKTYNRNNINFVFAQICFHCSNSRRGAGAVVNFEKDAVELYKFFNGFDPSEFSKRVRNTLKDDFYKEVKGENNPNDEKKMLKYYLESMHNYASYLSDKENNINNHNAFKNKFNCKNGFDDIVTTFIKINTDLGGKGIGEAFACDFFKDFDKDYSSFSKPDQHVKETINTFLKKSEDFDSLLDYVKIIDDICKKNKHKIKVNGKYFIVTPYILDRMIYLIKSENFFLDNVPQNKYLKEISNITF